MATTYGVTSTGFLKKPLATIDDEVDADLRTILGDSAGTDANGKIPVATYAGQIKTIMVDREAAYWDLLEEVYSQLDPSAANDSAQDLIGSLTGALRDSQAFSSVSATCTGTPLTVLPAARVATVTTALSRFLSTADATIIALTAWVTLTAYVVGDRRTNNNRCYVCITSGNSTTGPTTTAADIVDGTVHWKYLGEGTGAIDVTFQAESAGAIGALAGTLATIATPVSGWKNVTNLLDASVGRVKESNSDFRARRDLELAALGNTTPDAIRANILKLNESSDDPAHEAPTACKVFFNNTDYTDSNGVPPHSVEVLVKDGTDADISQTVWDSVGAGTRTYGNTTGTATDSEGVTQTVYWSRPTQIPIYVTAVGRYTAAIWPSGSEAIVAQLMLSAFLTYAEDYPIALDVRTSPLGAAIVRGPAATDTNGLAIVPADPAASAVPGLLEVESILISTTITPVSSAQITIGVREIAVFDSTRCVFTATVEDP